MRALLHSPLSAGLLQLKDDVFHHLATVVRVRVGDEILLLDGQGARARARVLEVGRRTVDLEVSAPEGVERAPAWDVLLVVPKREALESMLKMAVELGIRRVWLLRGDYSPEKIPEAPRLHALLRSALEQSNNPWMPEVRTLEEWREVPWSEYARVLIFDQRGAAHDEVRLGSSDGILTVIGPEGGFSESERASWPTVTLVALATPILRAPTALAAAWGWQLSKRV